MGVKKRDILSISPWIRRFSHLVPVGGRVLDLAAGSGRHAVWFLERGHDVIALDRVLDDLKALDEVSHSTTRPHLRLLQADLESGGAWPLQREKVDGIVVVNYLHRPLFPDLLSTLAPGGVLLYETFAVGQEAHGRPRRLEFLLKPGELLHRVQDHLQVVAYEHGRIDGEGTVAVKQRIAAIRTHMPAPIAPGLAEEMAIGFASGDGPSR